MSTIKIAGIACVCGETEFEILVNGSNKLTCVKCRSVYEFIARADILTRAPKEAKCRSCGAPVRWVKRASGKDMTVNAKLQNFVVLDNNGVGKMIKGYVPHWATCPDRDKFKRKGK